MSLYQQPNLTSGIDEAIASTAQAVPTFPIMILVFVFCLVTIGGYSNQRKRTGWGDFPMWCLLGSISATMLALIFTLTAGIITITTLSIVIAFTILCAVWFFLSRGRGE